LQLVKLLVHFLELIFFCTFIFVISHLYFNLLRFRLTINILFFVLLHLFSLNLFAKEPTLLIPNQTIYPENIEVFEDKTHQIKRFEEIKVWGKADGSVYLLGYTKSQAWLKGNFTINDDNDYVLYIDNARLYRFKIWIYDSKKTIIESISCGNEISPDLLKLKHNFPVIELKKLPKGDYYYYIQAFSYKDLIIPIRFAESQFFFQKNLTNRIFWGFYLGFLGLILIFNVLLYFYSRNRVYFIYSAYIITYAGFQFSVNGFNYLYVWGNSYFNQPANIFFLTLGNFMFYLFLDEFFKIHKDFKFWKMMYPINITVCLLLAIWELLDSNPKIYPIVFLWYSIQGVIYFYPIILKIRQGNRIAVFVCIGFLFIVLSTYTVGMRNLKIFPYFNLEYLIMVGNMLEIVMFSAALVYQMKKEADEKECQQNLREEISRNLHDDLAASISSLTMYSEKKRRDSQKNANENVEVFKKISEKSREILNMVRENVWEMNPRNDESEEWLDRMVKFANETLETKQIEIGWQIQEAVRAIIIPIEKRHDLYLFFKECINNIAKHSDAKLVKIQFSKFKNHLNLSITDNGKGFNINELSRKNGLINLQKRAENLKGKCNVESDIGKGTEVSLEF
jgi:signal transduction histidine kinase